MGFKDFWTHGTGDLAGSKSLVISRSQSQFFPFYMLRFLTVLLFWILSSTGGNHCVVGTECMTRRYYDLTVTIDSHGATFKLNRTLKCDMYFQWTVGDYCCYNKYDRYAEDPFCCYSEVYKLVLAVGLISLVLLASSFSIFCCWVYNLPHHILYLLTCGRFQLNNWTALNKNGPYVDPSFYSGVPFWSREAEMQPYGPLRPMPPKIFYPTSPSKLKRWDMRNGEIPLFIIASRQFTRNPYSARPRDPTTASSQLSLTKIQVNPEGLSSVSNSRRNSAAVSNYSNMRASAKDQKSRGHTPHPQRREASSAPHGAPTRGDSALLPHRGKEGNISQSVPPPPSPFRVNIDEGEAAIELMETLKMLDERGDKSAAEWNAMAVPDSAEGQSGNADHGIFVITRDASSIREGRAGITSVRPNTTGGGGVVLDQYGNYVSLMNQSSGGNRLMKPNVEALNLQFTTLGTPVFSMPGVHTAGVMSTIQNYHVVSANLGNPMETIVEDDSLDDDIIERTGDFRNRKLEKSSSSESSSSSASSSPTHHNQGKKFTSHQSHQMQMQRDISVVPRVPKMNQSSSSCVSSTRDHVLTQAPTTRAHIPFNPTLPGSLPERGSPSVMDAAYIDAVVNQRMDEPKDVGRGRRNSLQT